MICLTSASDRLLNVSIAINRPIEIACNVCILFVPYFSLFLPPFLCIVFFVCMYFFTFDATILVNKDEYI